MREGVDLGPVILQERVPIRPDDTVHTRVQRIKLEVGGRLLVRALEQIEQGTVAGRRDRPARGARVRLSRRRRDPALPGARPPVRLTGPAARPRRLRR